MRRPLEALHWLGAFVLALVALLVLGTVAAVLAEAGAVTLGPADWAAVRFTVLQAILSAFVSCLVAVPTARAIARRRFPGRSLLITLMGAPFILPVIVAVLGLVAIFGRNGLLATLLGMSGLPPVSIYGLHGVVIAHVFFNLPLATRLLLQGWLAIPAERFRLSASLGLGPAEIGRILERPMLREVLPGAFAVIFLVCLTSFAVALTLGGGPRATTVELAIFQAFTFDFDLARAASLALVQLALTLAAALVAHRFTTTAAMGVGLDRAVERWDAGHPLLRAQDALLLMLVAGFLIAPLAAVLVRGAGELPALPTAVWAAALRSLAVALASAALTLACALPAALLIAHLPPSRARVAEAAGYLSVAASPLVLGTGLFLLLRPVADPVVLALPVTAVVNAAMSLPFGLRMLVPAVRATETDFGRLADSLALTGLGRLRLLVLKRIRRPLGFAMGLAAAFSMGDLGVVALFADPEHATLPLQLYRLMAAYRIDAAMGAALLLMAMSLALFVCFDRGGRLAQA